MKYLLVVGAGKNQVPIIKTAKDLGCYVYVATVPGDYPGIEIADEWIDKNIFDTDGIVDYFSGEKRPIDGVISDQSDMAAPIVARIAEKLGLPNWGYENALYFTNKALMRELFGRIGLPIPPNKKVFSSGDAVMVANKIGFPVVVKPTDSFSSRGITLVKKEQDIPLAYKWASDNSRTQEVVIEKFIDGKQYFSQGFVSDYKLNLYAFSDRYYHDLPDVFIPYTNAFPAMIDSKLERRMTEDFEKIIEELKPRFGHVWAEWILDEKSNELYIVEMAIRGGGAYVTSDLIPLTYGVDTQPLLIQEALGVNTHFYEFKDFTKKAAAFYSFLLPEGVITEIQGLDKVEQISGVVAAHFKEMNVGDHTGKILDKRSRYGLIVIKGDNRKDLESIWRQLKDTIQIKVETEHGSQGAIWE